MPIHLVILWAAVQLLSGSGLAHAQVPAGTAAASVQSQDGLDPHRVADSAAPPVTLRNLRESERFWPYLVGLQKDHRPTAGPPILAGTQGVLIRVEESGVARIDFGRDGLHEVPVESTDLVAEANRVRMGELAKELPNFVQSVGPRLLDPSRQPMVRSPLLATVAWTGFLCVFADPGEDGFPDLVEALRPLRDHPAILTVLFSQGSLPDAELGERLRSLRWPVHFIYTGLSKPYTRTLLPEGQAPPAVQLLTNEGRLLFGSRWTQDALPALTQAIELTFPAAAGSNPPQKEGIRP